MTSASISSWTTVRGTVVMPRAYATAERDFGRVGQCSGMSPDAATAGAVVDDDTGAVGSRAEAPRGGNVRCLFALATSYVEEPNVARPDLAHRPAGALFHARPARSSPRITTLT